MNYSPNGHTRIRKKISLSMIKRLRGFRLCDSCWRSRYTSFRMWAHREGIVIDDVSVYEWFEKEMNSAYIVKKPYFN